MSPARKLAGFCGQNNIIMETLALLKQAFASLAGQTSDEAIELKSQIMTAVVMAAKVI